MARTKATLRPAKGPISAGRRRLLEDLQQGRPNRIQLRSAGPAATYSMPPPSRRAAWTPINADYPGRISKPARKKPTPPSTPPRIIKRGFEHTTPVRTLRSSSVQQIATPASSIARTPVPESSYELRSSPQQSNPHDNISSTGTTSIRESPYSLRSKAALETPQQEDDSPRYRLRSSGVLLTPPPETSINAGAPPILRQHKPVPTRDCIACGDAVSIHRSIVLPCEHSYCRGCLKSLVMLASTDEALYPPRCCAPIPPDAIAFALSRYEKTMFNLGRQEWATPAPNRLYCHKPKCGKFIPLPPGVSSKKTGWGKATCRRCKASTCIGCKKQFHYDDCDSENTTTTALKDVFGLADRENWKRCFKCKNMVERNGGCNHMTCRCGASFCYNCGRKSGTCKMVPQQQTGPNPGPPIWICVPRNQDVTLTTVAAVAAQVRAN